MGSLDHVNNNSSNISLCQVHNNAVSWEMKLMPIDSSIATSPILNCYEPTNLAYRLLAIAVSVVPLMMARPSGKSVIS
jgi:hypothetical protein